MTVNCPTSIYAKVNYILMKLITLIPAHNEAEGIDKAIKALRVQTRKPDQIIVIADNCSDNTAEIASDLGCDVWVTKDNRHKKAGALNQVLGQLLDILDDEDVILVQDADSFLDPEFIENGLRSYSGNVGGVGGVFRGRIESDIFHRRWLEAFQANEYARYELDIRRQKGRVLVLTGTATLLRVDILREVVQSRKDGLIPKGDLGVYDTTVLTEDNELSFALMRLGYDIKSPAGCTLTTETMSTWKSLAKQRLRWKRGALENLIQYGWDKNTRSYWGRQILALIGLIVTFTYFATIIYGLVVGIQLHAFWVGVTALFAIERAGTVRNRGWRSMAIASLVVVEMIYDFFLQAVQATAFFHAAIKHERSW